MGRHRKFDWHAAANAYESGQSIRDIARVHGVTNPSVLRALRLSGVAMRPVSTPSPRTVEKKAAREAVRGHFRSRAMRALWNMGWTLDDVGAAFGVSRQRVHEILHRSDSLHSLPKSEAA